MCILTTELTLQDNWITVFESKFFLNKYYDFVRIFMLCIKLLGLLKFLFLQDQISASFYSYLFLLSSFPSLLQVKRITEKFKLLAFYFNIFKKHPYTSNYILNSSYSNLNKPYVNNLHYQTYSVNINKSIEQEQAPRVKKVCIHFLKETYIWSSQEIFSKLKVYI